MQHTPTLAAPCDVLDFAVVCGGKVREVVLRRATLAFWAAVPDEPRGMLIAFEQHAQVIRKAVRRRLALIGELRADEVQIADFTECFVPDRLLPPEPLTSISPINLRSAA